MATRGCSLGWGPTRTAATPSGGAAAEAVATADTGAQVMSRCLRDSFEAASVAEEAAGAAAEPHWDARRRRGTNITALRIDMGGMGSASINSMLVTTQLAHVRAPGGRPRQETAWHFTHRTAHQRGFQATSERRPFAVKDQPASRQRARPRKPPNAARRPRLQPLQPLHPTIQAHQLSITAMQRSRQLAKLGARLRQAAAAGGGAATRAWQPAHQQLLSLNTLASNTTAAARTAPEHAAALAAGTRRQAAAAARRSFAADAMARPGPAPRGTSKAGKQLSIVARQTQHCVGLVIHAWNARLCDCSTRQHTSAGSLQMQGAYTCLLG